VRYWDTREASDEKFPRRYVSLEKSNPTSIFEDLTQKVEALQSLRREDARACFISAATMISFEDKTAFQIDRYIVEIDGTGCSVELRSFYSSRSVSIALVQREVIPVKASKKLNQTRFLSEQ
jgi:hypothetical protein